MPTMKEILGLEKPKTIEKIKVKTEITPKIKKTPKQLPKKSEIKNVVVDPKLIDQKINELVNERLLKLVNLGLTHELTIENLKKYIRSHKNKTKLYKLSDYFSEAYLSEISEMLDFLLKTRVITRNKHGWYSLK